MRLIRDDSGAWARATTRQRMLGIAVGLLLAIPGIVMLTVVVLALARFFQ
jgi:hypothetical protein